MKIYPITFWVILLTNKLGNKLWWKQPLPKCRGNQEVVHVRLRPGVVMHFRLRPIMRKKVTSSTRPKVHNVLQCHQRTLPGPVGTCTKNSGQVVLEISLRTNRHAHRHAHHTTPLPYRGGVTVGWQYAYSIIFCGKKYIMNTRNWRKFQPIPIKLCWHNRLETTWVLGLYVHLVVAKKQSLCRLEVMLQAWCTF